MRRVLAALAAVFLFFTCCACAEQEVILIDRITTPDASPEFSFAPEAELFQIIFPDVKDEDCALLLCGGDAVMIDCATRGHADRVVRMLRQLGIEEIDLIINSHPHNDHLLGLDGIASAVKVHALAFGFPEDETEHMAPALEAAKKHGIEVSWYEDGSQFRVGGAVIDVWLKGDARWNLNERSAQMRVQFGERTALFTADGLYKTQQRLVDVIEPELLDCDLLKYPHHGLKTLDEDFLRAVSPAYAVITNSLCDATFDARYRLSLRGVPYGVTSPGYLSFTTDGHIWLAERIPMNSVQGN